MWAKTKMFCVLFLTYRLNAKARYSLSWWVLYTASACLLNAGPHTEFSLVWMEVRDTTSRTFLYIFFAAAIIDIILHNNKWQIAFNVHLNALQKWGKTCFTNMDACDFEELRPHLFSTPTAPFNVRHSRRVPLCKLIQQVSCKCMSKINSYKFWKIPLDHD